MNRFKHVTIIFLIAQLAVTITAQAQLFLEDLVLYPDQFIAKKIHDNPDINQYYPFVDGHGNYPNLNAKQEFPKKIALISFYVWNNEIVTSNKTLKEFWEGSTWVDSVRGNKLASSLIGYSLESIVSRFDSLGVKIITPNTFTPAQHKAYDSVQIHYLSSYRKKVPDSISYELCSAVPFRFIKLPNQKLDYDFANSFTDLAKILNVDAVLIIENQVAYTGTLGLINTISMNMYGFNPMNVDHSAEQNLKKGVRFNDFLLYTSIELDVEAIVSQYNEDKELKYENYIGYDRLLDLMIDQLYRSYQERTKILPKKS
jgi:hypothetical protein